MVAALPGEFELFEHARLNGLGAQLHAADQHAGVPFAGLPLGALAELVGVKGHEVAALPQSFEESVHLVKHVGVAGAGDTEVPLVARDGAMVGEIRRADVGGRETTAPLEDPGLGMQARGPGVVGDSDLCAEFGQLLEGLELRRAGEGGRQQPQTTSARDVVAERVAQRPNATPPDEGHDQLDPIRRVDLAQQLPRQRGLAGRVAE